MNIVGAKYYNDPNRYYTQTNNPEEEVLRKSGAERAGKLIALGVDPSIVAKAGVRSFLETCGPTSATNCILAKYDIADIKCPGGYNTQKEQQLADWFNDPGKYSVMRPFRKELNPALVMCNRIPQYYPPAVKEVFGIDCEFKWVKSIDEIVDIVKAGNPVQICLKDPGHYVAVVAVDLDTSDFIINDPWPGRFPDNKGFNKILFKSEWINVNLFIIVY